MMSAQNVHVVQSFFEQIVPQDEWDAPPLLLLMIDNGSEQHGMAAVPIHDHHWSAGDGDPIPILNQLADSWEEHGFSRNGLPDEFVITGFALLNEVWTFSKEDAETPSGKEAVDNHKIFEHPGRIEAKILTAVDFEDNVVIVYHERGERSAQLVTNFDKNVPGGDRDPLIAVLKRMAATAKA